MRDRSNANEHRGGWFCVAVCVFGLALATTYSGFWGADLSTDVPIPRRMVEQANGEPHALGGLRISDYRAAVWSVARNAHALIHQPTRLFDAEMCHPVENSLALHHPILAPAVIALPVHLVTGDPVATFNAALWLEVLLAAIAMYLLVSEWTGVRAAGIAAGLLFAFHPERIDAPFHFFVHDDAWFLLVLLFARRLFEHGRIRDAVALGVVSSLQIGTSSYALYAAFFAAIPIMGWLVWLYGIRRVLVGPLLIAAVPIAATAVIVIGPYLAMQGSELQSRSIQYFASWSWLLPGQQLFPGFAGAALIVAVALAGKRRVLGGRTGDPRLVLAAAALFLMLVAADGNRNAQFAGLVEALSEAPVESAPAISLPHFYFLASALLPGLGVIRIPSALAFGVLQLLCLLAGLGAAGLLRAVPERQRGLASVGLIVVVFAETLLVAPRGPAFPNRFAPYRMRPPESRIALFERLEELGNRGPVLELPILWESPPFVLKAASAQMLLTAYHHRPTSGCRGSFIPDRVRDHQRTSSELLGPHGAERARADGFTTLILHHGGPGGTAYLNALRAADAGRGTLEEIASSETMTAFSIRER